jgi:hypothetical protein
MGVPTTGNNWPVFLMNRMGAGVSEGVERPDTSIHRGFDAALVCCFDLRPNSDLRPENKP